jgi:hypothetical protein
MARLSGKRAPKRDTQVIDLLSSGASSPVYVQGFQKPVVNIKFNYSCIFLSGLVRSLESKMINLPSVFPIAMMDYSFQI